MPALPLILLTLILTVSAFWLGGIIRWRQFTTRLVGGSQAQVDADLPTISIIIAGRNEDQFVRTCLKSLLRLDYPPEKLEILFVDDHSTDRTHEFAIELLPETAGRLRVLRATETPVGMGPKKHALTCGIRESHGDILLFTDADTAVQPGWARAVVQCYGRNIGAVAAATLPPDRRGWGNWLFRGERLMVAVTSASAVGYGSPASVSGQNFSFRRSVFDQLGGYAFKEIPSGDDDLMIQAIVRQGWKVKFAHEPQSVVSDLRPPTPRAQLNAAARHQSILRFYPLGWRIAYGLSILSGLALLALAVGALISSAFVQPFIFVVVTKLILDTMTATLFARRLRLSLSLSDILIWQLLLPVYLVLRPLALLRRSFEWRNRAHVRTPETVKAAS